MNKVSRILKIIGIVVVVSTVFSISEIHSQPIGGTDERLIIGYFDSIQINPIKDYIYELESFISENRSASDARYLEENGINRPEPYARYLRERAINRSEPYSPHLREKAIFVLTDIAIRKNQSEEVIGFLKNIAINEKNDSVRNAAYANIDLIREISPLKSVGSMDINVIGKIQKGENISIIARISSTNPLTAAIIGINSLHRDIEILSSPIVKISIPENESHLLNQSVEFKLKLKEAGRYKIPISLLMSLDRIDYDSIHKDIYLNVSSTNSALYDAVRIEG